MLSRLSVKVARAATARMAVRASSTNTIIAGKEAAEETRFIREQEANILKARLEKALAAEGAAKEQLVEILDAQEQKKSIDLTSWKFALPLGFFAVFPALTNEWIVLDAELQLAACFFLFCSTMHAQVGPMLNKQFADYSAGVRNELAGLDGAVSSDLKNLLQANLDTLTIKEDVQELYQLQDAVALGQADVLTKKAAIAFNEAIIKKMDALVALEDSATAAIRNRMVNKVQASAVDILTNDKKVKEDALNSAIAALSAGPSGKLGKDIVGEAFVTALQTYKADYAKNADKDEILIQLQKDVAAISVAPVIDAKGGNVYEL